MIDQNNSTTNADCVRILLLQFSCVLVEQALPHTDYAANKTNNLRCLMNFAWLCFIENNCVDPATRYHGHLLLSHVVAKFAIPKLSYRRVFMRGNFSIKLVSIGNYELMIYNYDQYMNL